MITAYGGAETKRKALESGEEALLTKPIDFVTLRNEGPPPEARLFGQKSTSHLNPK
jgi:hypothetical protein